MTRLFPTPFSRVVVVTALSASLAFSPMAAAPAKAGGDEVGAIAAATILGLITAGVIVSAANEANAGQRDTHHGRPYYDPDKLLPAQCNLHVRKGPDKGHYYERGCLHWNFRGYRDLPDQCKDEVWIPREGQNETAFDARCLARFGYRGERTVNR